jgi:hypothetical protein
LHKVYLAIHIMDVGMHIHQYGLIGDELKNCPLSLDSTMVNRIDNMNLLHDYIYIYMYVCMYIQVL